MELPWRFGLTHIITIVVAIATVGAMLFVNTYFKPELWYEEGPYYRSGDRAITSLRVQNYGHSDAEDVRISVSFPDTILDLSTGEAALPFTVKSGGIGSKATWGTITRLVPDESVYLYFALKNPEGEIPANYNNFVVPKGIVYKGGIAKQGKPSDLIWLIVAWLSTLFSAIITISSFLTLRMTKQQQLENRRQIDELTRLQLENERAMALQFSAMAALRQLSRPPD